MQNQEYDVPGMIERLKLISVEIKAKKAAEENEDLIEEQTAADVVVERKDVPAYTPEPVRLVFGQKPPKRSAKAKVEKPKQESMF